MIGNMFKTNNQSGAVSLFVVVFASLLITVIVVGFVRIMIQDQRQATAAELSQSAYDSALAGVEDAKRALAIYQDRCSSNPDTQECIELKQSLNSNTCNAAIANNLDDVVFDSSEVKIEQPGKSNTLDQAYTCVKINLDTFDYLGHTPTHLVDTIPLEVTPGSSVNEVLVEWFNLSDIGSIDGGNTEVDLYDGDPTAPLPLPAQNTWPTNRPPVLRLQVIQYSETAGFSLSDFDDNSDSQSNTNTIFLYPTPSDFSGTIAIADIDARRSSSARPYPASCRSDLASGGYACSARIALPEPIGGGERVAFLNLSSIYGRATYRVSPFSGSQPVRFNSVQPEVDSTGRASDLFRRVRARISMGQAQYTPSGAVDISGSLCKSFLVSEEASDYQWLGSCDPVIR
jgi:hypothetical protein